MAEPDSNCFKHFQKGQKLVKIIENVLFVQKLQIAYPWIPKNE
jgi:hypothetical protein